MPAAISVKKYTLLPQRPAKKLNIQIARKHAFASTQRGSSTDGLSLRHAGNGVAGGHMRFPLAGHTAPGNQQPLHPYRHERTVREAIPFAVPNGNPRRAVVEAVKENYASGAIS